MKTKTFWILIVAVIQFTTIASGAIPETERAALVALYNSTNGDDWYDHGGWKTPPLHTDGFAMPGTEGNWFGVVISEDHVTKLNMERNHMSGTIPTQLGTLSHLEELMLWGNELSGSIPSDLGNLSLLTQLYLDRNKLTGEIPAQLGNLSHLTMLVLSLNKLSGSIPSNLGNLSQLEGLFLYGNELNGEIPAQLSNLHQLKNLYLGANQLNGSIPSELGNLSHLETLNLDANQLSGTIPPELGNLNTLQYLVLSNNHLSGSITAELGSLNQLKELNLTNNLLNGEIPLELGNLENLNFLYLGYNQLNGSIPSILGNLSHLSYLVLANNQLTGMIPSQLGNIPMLQTLDLRNNQLIGKIPSGLGNLTNLKYMYLHHNQLSGTIPLQFGDLQALRGLYLNNNLLSGDIPTVFGNLQDLYTLFIDHNYLSGTIPSTLTNLTKIDDLDVGYNCLSASDTTLRSWLSTHQPDWESHQNQCQGKTTVIHLSVSELTFGNITAGSSPYPQTVSISNNGSGSLNWSSSCSASWLSVTPASGTGNSILSVAVNPDGLAKGTYTGVVLITDPNALNSPQPINVSLTVYDPGESLPPFGDFSTPVNGASVSSSIAVTGWVLDDIGVANVRIYNGNTYVGDAVFVEGARPDIETLYPHYPNANKAGWGYMLLTNMLPDGGNGTYTLIAKAIDMEGNEITLGSKTITIDNAHATKPFGAIDTPTQGGTISGKGFESFGWALTPQPNFIPTNGSTIDVVIDGVIKGHPGYNNFRSDIAQLFPDYENANGASGYFSIDTTTLANGLHTLSWNVTDNAGNTDGIGSRYFSVLNTGVNANSWSLTETQEKPFEALISADGDGKWIEIRELERVEIDLSKEMGLSDTHFQGYLRVGNQLRQLPIGSTLDQEKGIFYWQPGPGFVGEYRFVFIGSDKIKSVRKYLNINIR
ncbi:MAG: BACON domain-containing protein [Candidatus Omnitrophota bacterium]